MRETTSRKRNPKGNQIALSQQIGARLNNMNSSNSKKQRQKNYRKALRKKRLSSEMKEYHLLR